MHIHTLTGNLLWEQTLEFASWAPGRTQRAEKGAFQVGGKGVNVSKMLGRLGAANTALIFTSGSTGSDCETWLAEKRIAFRSFPSRRATRVGVVVRGGGMPETTFLGPDESPGGPALRACADYLDSLPDGGLLAVCGSLPGWESPDYDPLREAFSRWIGRGPLAADTYGPPLDWFAARPLALVKINRAEFEGWKAKRTGPSPVREWIVTDGPRPIAWTDERGGTGSMAPPRVRELSATGSGDVLFACVLKDRFLENRPLEQALAFALPYAAANASHPGIAEFPGPVTDKTSSA